MVCSVICYLSELFLSGGMTCRREIRLKVFISRGMAAVWLGVASPSMNFDNQFESSIVLHVARSKEDSIPLPVEGVLRRFCKWF